MFLTPNTEWRWQNFEAELLYARSLAELNQAESNTSESLRRAVMKTWQADDRYQWLADKAEAFKKFEEQQAMFWSSRPKELPAVGDIVRIAGEPEHNRPYTVTRRAIDSDGSVWLWGEDGDHVIDKAPVEVFSWWPMAGDKVSFLVGAYIDWLKAQRQFQKGKGNKAAVSAIDARLAAHGATNGHIGGAVLDLINSHSLLSIKGELGVVEVKGKQMRAPLSALVVCDRVAHVKQLTIADDDRGSGRDKVAA